MSPEQVLEIQDMYDELADAQAEGLTAWARGDHDWFAEARGRYWDIAQKIAAKREAVER